ncbi:MAG TPA: response regulator, partial [Myxococcaceae bacterium]|nr:response regulator [Myxococcaceae bacterium]
MEPRYSLLVVDDEQPVLDVLVRSFSGRFNVLSATSGPEALEIMRKQRPDVLLTDQRMPEMTGLELVRAARAEGIDTTAILLTGYAAPDELVAAIQDSLVFRYVNKPWDVNDLLIAVKNAMEVTQLKRDKERLLSKLKKSAEAQFVLYEASHQTAGGVPTYDAIIDRVLSAVAPVLPYDCGAALVVVDANQSATLRLKCGGVVGDQGLLQVKDSVLSAHRKETGQLVPEDRLITSVSGTTRHDLPDEEDVFTSQLTVPLVSCGRQVGTLSLFSRQQHAYSAEDGEMLDVLANQTTDAILALRASEEESRHRTERMVETMADGVILTDEKHRVAVLNPAARQMLRLPDDPAEWTARNLQSRLGFTPFDVVRRWEMGGTQVIREELKLYDRTLQSTVTPSSDSRGNLRGVCVILRDITEQKQLEERKDELVSIISHELRTPLTSISGALDLVLNRLAGEINEKQHRYLSMAKESTDKLDAIVDDLLDISKFAKGRLRMNFELTRLDDVVRRAVEKYGPVMIEKGLRLRSHVPSSGILALASPNRLGQVLNNLLTNAVKFTPEHGEVEVELHTSSQAPGYAIISCWNSGEGIPEADLERIFEKFEQARSERTRTVRGTGLGLAISRSIVEAHGGQVWAEPCSDGARFVAVLPLEPPPELLQPGGAEPEKPAKLLYRPTILVVEEEVEVAYTVKAILLNKGYKVRLAPSADEGAALTRRIHPDAVLVASRLPGQVDGYGLVELIRNDPETRTAAVVMMAGVEERPRAFREGVSGFLPKPIPADRVISTVDAVLKGRTAKKRARVLVVDADLKSIGQCSDALGKLGFDVSSASSLIDARKALRDSRPELMLIDLKMPDGDALAFVEEQNVERGPNRVP